MKECAQDWAARILSREWLGLAVAAGIAAAAWGCRTAGAPAWAVAIALIAAVALALGSLRHLARLAAVRRRHPPRGRLVDVGGTRIHVLAEGEARGGVWPVVWLPGGHGAGLSMDHLHRALRGETRSILIDRPGSGWSDTGPFPRSTVREVDEVLAALDAAGEKGPFVFAGYSFGGLLAANIARRHPDRVARLVLIDATPLETLVFGPRLGAIRDMRRDALMTALARLAGLGIDFQRRRAERNPAYAASGKAFRTQLGEAYDALVGIEVSAGARMAEWSIYRELLGPFIAAHGWETVVYDGDLGDMPVWLVAPQNPEEVADQPEIAGAGAEAARMMRFFARTRERYLATSTNSRRVVAPAGATHQFVYEHADFVIATMRAAVRA